MTTSLSDKILQALAQHGRLNTRQLAAKISCDTKKTTQLVSFMRTSKKLRTDGEIDGLAAYSLTDLGRSLIRSDSPAPASSPRSIDDLADAQIRPPKVATSKQQPIESPPAPHSQPEPAADMWTPSTRPPMHTRTKATKFGMLSTGEFLILIDERAITIPAADVPVMRAQLNAAPAGVAK
ncbi:hypothetical protein [Achromobacter mucicolens]|uniref:hypothetical protein n=1 Tax=Achromobacter mucicolens TaxID=1389922 RepID=UPI0028A26BAD|nr:hypothetical protein [Achromobacter mucicolens]